MLWMKSELPMALFDPDRSAFDRSNLLEMTVSFVEPHQGPCPNRQLRNRTTFASMLLYRLRHRYHRHHAVFDMVMAGVTEMCPSWHTTSCANNSR